jgi:hypothetical protein
MPSFSFNSLAMLLAPGRILSGHLSDQLTELLGQARSSRGLGLPAPEQPKSFALPSDQRIRLHIHQRIPPLEHSAQGGHHPPGGIVGPSCFTLPLLEQRQLLPKEEVFRHQRAVGACREQRQSDQVEHDQRQDPKAVCNGAEN